MRPLTTAIAAGNCVAAGLIAWAVRPVRAGVCFKHGGICLMLKDVNRLLLLLLLLLPLLLLLLFFFGTILGFVNSFSRLSMFFG